MLTLIPASSTRSRSTRSTCSFVSTPNTHADSSVSHITPDNNYCGLTNYDNSNDWDFSTWWVPSSVASWTPADETFQGQLGEEHVTQPQREGLYRSPCRLRGRWIGLRRRGNARPDCRRHAQLVLVVRRHHAVGRLSGIRYVECLVARARNHTLIRDPHAANDRFDAAVKSSITENGNTAPAPSTTYSSATSTATATPTTAPAPSTTSTPAAPSSSPTGSAGDCAGVATWVANVAYEGGDQVVYNGNLYTAKWWSYADTPGGASLGSIQG